MMILLQFALVIYVIGFILQGIVATALFGISLNEWGKEDEDTKKMAAIMLSTPIWPLYWGKRLVILIAGALNIVKETEEKEKK